MNTPPLLTDVTAPGAEPATLERRRQQFLRFAETECSDDPLYVALCRLLAERPAALALLDAAPRTQQRPNLLLAAIHERVLAGAGGGFAAWFPSMQGDRPAGEALAAAFDDFLVREAPRLAAHCATRATQTNEAGRCAVLWPALAQITAAAGARPLALFDFGCSAGLNLGVDRYRYRHGSALSGALDDPAAPWIDCHPVGGLAPPELAPARIVARLGVDPAPVDLHDADATRWLQACLWPHDQRRRARFDQAAAIVRGAGWAVRREADCFAAIEPWLDTLPRETLPVVFNSWVLAYFDAAALQRHIDAMRALVQRRRVFWLSAEGPGLALGTPPPLPAGDQGVSAAELANASSWWLTRPDADPRLIARSHPHGRWVAWNR
ncbi:DUF2332 domain-containing protein [Aquincola sp. S2]|uniref:DUF2332 domain-containing protein n=1 Tax=Pseudaquabacterium terrae TaxID=2732868 RepID=A0ABX2ELK2_9BURK|nr:DUF2332 domain-containing protein [Aquabacterium terrae]NRF69528.1 DUF2332 domain-containing protein [Aquabacterium terrae]